MGIGGHILGDRKLRALNRLTGMDFDRAYNRNGYVEARQIEESGCVHYRGEAGKPEMTRCEPSAHWSSCYKQVTS